MCGMCTKIELLKFSSLIFLQKFCCRNYPLYSIWRETMQQYWMLDSLTQTSLRTQMHAFTRIQLIHTHSHRHRHIHTQTNTHTHIHQHINTHMYAYIHEHTHLGILKLLACFLCRKKPPMLPGPPLVYL